MTRAEYLSCPSLYARRGLALPQARLTPQAVRDIRASTETAAQCAMRYGVHIRTTDKVRTYRSWRHVL